MDAQTLTLLKQITGRHLDSSHRAFIFGSRAQGTNRPFSDLDLGIDGQPAVSTRTLTLIKSELEESNLPYRVDVIDFSQVKDSFKKVAMQKVINL